MFRGLNTIQLDEKGRFRLPVKYHEMLAAQAEGQLIGTIDTEARCLLLYPFSDWKKIEEKIETLPSFNRAARRIQRLLIGHATELELDAQGRLLLPPSLRDYAGLKKTMVLLGQGRKLELWDETEWQTARQGWLEEGLDLGGNVPPELEYLSL